MTLDLLDMIAHWLVRRIQNQEVHGSNPLPRLTFHSYSGYQLNQLGSKAAIECHIVIDTVGYKLTTSLLLVDRLIRPPRRRH